jgi:hypothetical protein
MQSSIALLQQRILVASRPTPAVHVGLVIRDLRTGDQRLFHHGADVLRSLYTLDTPTLTPMPLTPYTLDEIKAYEATLPRYYVLGIRDCRHHVRDLLRWCCVDREA